MRALTLAGVAAGLLALHAPAASAHHVDAGCGFYGTAQDEPTSSAPRELVVGHVVAHDDTPTIQCVLYVNGVESDRTPASAATPTVAVTAGRLAVSASGTDVVALCAVVTTQAHGRQTYCPPPLLPRPSPRDVLDAVAEPVEGVFTDVVDPVVCAALVAQRPAPEPVRINEQGDVWVGDEHVWECPPYEW